jgi:ABC-type branched-subunit amino acid transport system substrate-binding protein
MIGFGLRADRSACLAGLFFFFFHFFFRAGFRHFSRVGVLVCVEPLALRQACGKVHSPGRLGGFGVNGMVDPSHSFRALSQRRCSVLLATRLRLRAIPLTIEIGVAQPLSRPSAARGKTSSTARSTPPPIERCRRQDRGQAVRFEIVAMDDKADKEEARRSRKPLVDRKVVAVIGHLSSDVTEDGHPIYKAATCRSFHLVGGRADQPRRATPSG